MKMMILAILMATVLLFVASFSIATNDMDDMFVMIEDTCTLCHGLDRSCAKLGKDLLWWEGTVQRMQARSPSITNDQVQSIAAYLAAPPQDFIKACE